MQSGQRPKYLNLMQIRLPLPGVVSIAHRISGTLMFLAIPFVTYVLHVVVQDEAGFLKIRALMDNVAMKLVLLVLIWSLLHHFFAGIRYLLIDFDVGVDKPTARTSAAVVMVAAIASAIVMGIFLI